MSLKKLVFAVLVCVVLAAMAALQTGCANIIPPTGGPKDTLPPTLISANPKDSALRFTGKEIRLVFDEYIQLENASQNIIVNPVPKIVPNTEARLRTLIIRIKDTLEANTTYSINFGNSLKDINEGNPFRQFTYVFSTGTFLDDKTLSGKVTLAENGKIDSTLMVMLYREGDDSSVIKKRPRYITTVDNKGNFTFRNLPTGQFYLYATKDDTHQGRYLNKTQLFAFADKPVQITAKNEPVDLYAYVEKEEEKKKPAAATNAPAKKDTKNQDKRLRYQTNLDGGAQDILDSLAITFASPLKTFDTTQLVFADDKLQPLVNYSFISDSLHQKFTLLYTWKPGTEYKLILKKDLAEDSTGKTLPKNDTIAFKTKKLEDYGILRLRFASLDLSRHPVLLLLQNDNVVFTHVFTTKEFYVKLFKPGDYHLRILYDENRNGKWDAGTFFGTRRQPEKVQPIEKPVTVKANWEKDDTITF